MTYESTVVKYIIPQTSTPPRSGVCQQGRREQTATSTRPVRERAIRVLGWLLAAAFTVFVLQLACGLMLSVMALAQHGGNQ